MTRDQFNHAAAADFCVFSVHLQDTAFGQKDARDRACTFQAAAEGWIDAQEQKTRAGILSCSVKGSEVTIIANGPAIAQLDQAFAKEIRYMGVHEYAPLPPAKPAAVSIFKRDMR